jgi:hypothetical protein
MTKVQLRQLPLFPLWKHRFISSVVQVRFVVYDVYARGGDEDTAGVAKLTENQKCV